MDRSFTPEHESVRTEVRAWSAEAMPPDIEAKAAIGGFFEHDVGLYFKRMPVLGAPVGDQDYHTRRFAGLPHFTAEITDSSDHPPDDGDRASRQAAAHMAG